jgi:Protein of unknown function (DUF1579)
MKRTNYCLLLLLFSPFSPTRAQGQADAQKAWVTYMTPGPIHKMIAASDGDWKAEMSMWESPGSAPTTSIASCTNKMILGGRYQESKITGTFMGMPFEGMGTLAYDNAKKVFISSWIDNMGTGMMNLQGSWDAGTKSITFLGKMTDPMSGKDMPYREVFKMIDDNTQQMDMYAQMNGQEFKTMEIKLTRK